MSVGSITTTSSRVQRARARAAASARSPSAGSSSRPKNRRRVRARRRAPARSSRRARPSCRSRRGRARASPSIAARDGCPAPGTVSRWPASSTGGRAARPGEHAGVAEVVAPRRRRPQDAATCSASAASSRDSDGMSISSSVRAARRSASSPAGQRRTLGRADSRMGGLGGSRNGRTPSPATPPPPRPGRGEAARLRASPPRRRARTSRSCKELLRTAGVPTVGELVQNREQPHPNLYLGPGKVDELKALLKEADANVVVADDELTPAPAAQPGEGARAAGARPHGGDPRHLRRPRPHGRGQAAGRAGAARVQHGPHARPVDAPRASGRRPRRRRHRHPRPGRVADRDGPPAGARPHHRAHAPARPGASPPARSSAPSASARTCPRRAGRLHERRQVDAAQRADRRRGRRPRPAVPHARPDDPHAAPARAART